MRLSKYILIALMPLLVACGGGLPSIPNWIGGDENGDFSKLEGTRISVLEHRQSLGVSSQSDKINIVVSDSKINSFWNLQNIAPTQHPALNKALKNSSNTSIGGAAEGGLRLTSAPIIANDKVFTLDGEGNIEARLAADIDELLWTTKIDSLSENDDFVNIGFGLGFGSSVNDKEFLGGNISYAAGIVFATTGRGNIYAISGKNGKIIWKRSVTLPAKSSPIVSDGFIFVITSDNTLYALDILNGKTKWTHSGISESASIYGVPSPVVRDKIIVVPYSSGEILALDIETGKTRWTHLLARKKQNHTKSFLLNDIDATPVISDGRIYAVSNDGILISIDLYSGQIFWKQDISSVNTPWKDGDFLYILTSENQVVAIHAPTGLIKWISQLPDYTKSKLNLLGGKNKRISYKGPVLAQNKLLVSGSHGKMVLLTPFSGKIIEQIDIINNVYLAPVIANKRIFILNNEAQLMTIY